MKLDRIMATVCLLATAVPILAQSPPADLTELDLESILALYILRVDGPVETAQPWNFSYQLVYARFDGNRDGTQDLTYDEVVWDRGGGETRTTDNFPVVPLAINQQAHIFGVGYAISPRWTINLLVPYLSIKIPTTRA